MEREGREEMRVTTSGAKPSERGESGAVDAAPNLEPKAIFNVVRMQIYEARACWNLLDESTDEEKRRLLNETMPRLGEFIQRVLFERLLLALGRVLDPAAGGPGNRPNASLAWLQEYSPLAGKLRHYLQRIHAIRSRWEAGPLEWRNRLLAHADLQSLLDRDAVTPIVNADITRIVHDLCELFQEIERDLFDGEFAYEIHPLGIGCDLEHLYELLRCGTQTVLERRAARMGVSLDELDAIRKRRNADR